MSKCLLKMLISRRGSSKRKNLIVCCFQSVTFLWKTKAPKICVMLLQRCCALFFVVGRGEGMPWVWNQLLWSSVKILTANWSFFLLLSLGWFFRCCCCCWQSSFLHFKYHILSAWILFTHFVIHKHQMISLCCSENQYYNECPLTNKQCVLRGGIYSELEWLGSYVYISYDFRRWGMT